MRCRDVANNALQLRDGAVRAHVAECRACALYVAQLRVTARALQQLGVEPAPPSSREAALEAFRALRGASELRSAAVTKARARTQSR